MDLHAADEVELCYSEVSDERRVRAKTNEEVRESDHSCLEGNMYPSELRISSSRYEEFKVNSDL